MASSATIIAPRTTTDIIACVKIYEDLNDFSFVNMSPAESIRTISAFSRAKKFIRIKIVDNEIVAWILCDVAKPMHQEELQFQQIYYASKRSGIKAYSDVLDLHTEMEKEARIRKIPLLLSTGSHMDETNVFTRILERNGWQRRGYVALKRLD